jgi:hypothetical protein
MWQKYLMVQKGMTASEVNTIVPAPTSTVKTDIGQQVSDWYFGRLFADNLRMTVIFGKDGRVESVDREVRPGEPQPDCSVIMP